MHNIKAFIFDMDGVITDTSKQHFDAWRRLASELGCSLDNSVEPRLRGVSREDSLEIVLESIGYIQLTLDERQNLMKRKNDYYLKSIQEIHKSDAYPGIPELLDYLRERNMLLGLASASRNAASILAKLELKDRFDVIVDPASVKQGKPSPEIFLTAAAKLNISPENCIGIEDAPAGITSICSAGMTAIGIGDSELLSNANYVFSNTEDLKVAIQMSFRVSC
jgi:beta-phosphoglucomutase